MNKNEESNVEMYAKVEAFLVKNQDKFVAYPRLNTEISTFIGLRLVLLPMVAKQSEVTTGITANKTIAFTKLGALLVEISKKASIWARDKSDLALVAAFAISTSSYKYQSQTKQLIQAQGMLEVLIENAAALVAYNIEAADILAITNAINACEGHAIAPGAASSDKKAATTAIKTLVVNINASLINIDDMITSQYTKSDPDLVNVYLNNRRLDAKGVRHTGISAKFTDAATGMVIENATIEITTLGKTAVSNINGIAEIAKMKTGTYHVNFSANGYAPQMQDIIVARGRTVEVAVSLVLI